MEKSSMQTWLICSVALGNRCNRNTIPLNIWHSFSSCQAAKDESVHESSHRLVPMIESPISPLRRHEVNKTRSSHKGRWWSHSEPRGEMRRDTRRRKQGERRELRTSENAVITLILFHPHDGKNEKINWRQKTQILVLLQILQNAVIILMRWIYWSFLLSRRKGWKKINWRQRTQVLVLLQTLEYAEIYWFFFFYSLRKTKRK